MEELLEGPGAGRPTDTHCPPAGGPWFTHQDTHSLRESLLGLGRRHVEPYIPIGVSIKRGVCYHKCKLCLGEGLAFKDYIFRRLKQLIIKKEEKAMRSRVNLKIQVDHHVELRAMGKHTGERA